MENPTTPLIISFVAGFGLLAIITLTSFVKMSVVLMIVRQALGLQQVPGNMVVMTLSAFLAVLVSLPVFRESFLAVSAIATEPETAADLLVLLQRGLAPFQIFLSKNIDPAHMGFFVETATDLWRGSGMVGTDDNIVLQIPAFMISELTAAFKIGFLLYLPFVAIDLAITGILMALGMQMVQPNIIAVPFKLLIFVFVDGWSKLINGLMLSYVG